LEILAEKGQKRVGFFLEHLFEGLPPRPGRPLEHLSDTLAAPARHPRHAPADPRLALAGPAKAWHTLAQTDRATRRDKAQR
jgi:hypothetical protein